MPAGLHYYQPQWDVKHTSRFRVLTVSLDLTEPRKIKNEGFVSKAYVSNKICIKSFFKH